jgi:hypothetical protein
VAPVHAGLEELRAAEPRLAGRLEALEGRVETRISSADLVAAMGPVGEQLERVESQLRTCASQMQLSEFANAVREQLQTELSEVVDAVREQLQTVEEEMHTRASQADLSQVVTAVREQLQTAEAEMRTRASQVELSEVVKAIREQLQTAEAELRSEAGSASDEVRTAIQQLRSDFEGIARRQRLFAEQVKQLQYGPGDPEKPCLAGGHRGFTLVHYRGRAYGLRKHLDPSVVLQSVEHSAEYGPDEVISADSVDGVRARIDALDSSHGLHDEMTSLRRELLVAQSDIAEALRRTHVQLEEQASNLDRLAHAWPNRMWSRFSSTK